MAKKTIRITEAQLKSIIRECVERSQIAEDEMAEDSLKNKLKSAALAGGLTIGSLVAGGAIDNMDKEYEKSDDYQEAIHHEKGEAYDTEDYGNYLNTVVKDSLRESIKKVLKK